MRWRHPVFVSFSKSFRFGLPIPGDKIQSAHARLLNSVKLIFLRHAVCFLVFVYYSFNALLFVGRCHFKGFDKDLRREGGNYCSMLSVFNIFVFCVFLITSCFTYNQLFVGRCHFKDFWSEGSRERRERVRLSSFVSSAFGVNVKERRSRIFDDN